MPNKTYIGAFHSIDTVLYKITELEAQGHSRNDIYAISKVKDDLSILRAEAAIDILDVADRRLLDRNKKTFSDEEQALDLLKNIGFSEHQARVYYEDVKDGGIALFVEDSEKNHHPDDVGSSDEMDSSVERGPNGEVLDGQEGQEQVLNNELTVPRINTTNL